jgi:hypothetical protein
MKMLSKLMIVYGLAAIIFMPCHASDHSSSSPHLCKSERKREHQDPIIGAWVYNFFLPGQSPINGVAVFHADKTWTWQDTGNLTQDLLGNEGAFATMSTGFWEKVGKRRYIVTGSNVFLARNPASLASPAIPFARVKVIQDFVLNPRSKSASSTITGTFHPPDDLTLSLPGPIPDILTGKVEWRKQTKQTQ